LLSAEQIEKTLEFLRDNLINQAEVGIEINKLHFSRGQQLLDYIKEIKSNLKEDEIEQ
jgi:coproporphyrinogen III oxidase-like Fe-S oxidoreductase